MPVIRRAHQGDVRNAFEVRLFRRRKQRTQAAHRDRRQMLTLLDQRVTRGCCRGQAAIMRPELCHGNPCVIGTSEAQTEHESGQRWIMPANAGNQGEARLQKQRASPLNSSEDKSAGSPGMAGTAVGDHSSPGPSGREGLRLDQHESK